jgi:acyl-CoA thioesterase-1
MTARPVHLLAMVARTALLTLAVVASLLTFPNAVPWMIAGWLTWHSAARLGGRSGLLPVVLGTAVAIVKLVPFSLPMVSLGAAIGLAWLAGWLAASDRTKPPPRWVRLAGLAMVWLAWAAMAFDWFAAAHTRRKPALRADRPIVCLGDSLTSDGTPRGGYPERLARRLSVPVLNRGRPGLSATEAARRRLAEVLADEPQAVVVELGGHEFNQDRPRGEARAALETIIRECRLAGAEVILMEIPRGYLLDPYRFLERELARQYDLELIPDTSFRWIILNSKEVPPGKWHSGPHLADDALHPNDAGQEYLAEKVAETLRRLYGPEICKD